MFRFAIYGKGGIGKSTTVSNIAAALAKLGHCVLQIGCDPKADSTIYHNQGQRITSVLDVLRSKGTQKVLFDDIVHQADNGVWCVEAGGPSPGTGCAGRGIVAAFEALSACGAFERIKPDVVIYDVLGDVVCGGFAMPIRKGYADNVFILTSGENMAIYAAGNIAQAVDNFKERGYARLAGIILNSRNVENERQKVEELAETIGTEVVAVLPRSPLVQKAEEIGKTVVDAFEDSDMAQQYYDLAKTLLRVSRPAESKPVIQIRAGEL